MPEHIVPVGEAYAEATTDLEYLGLQLVANAEHCFDSGGTMREDWITAAKRYTEMYHAKLDAVRND